MKKYLFILSCFLLNGAAAFFLTAQEPENPVVWHDLKAPCRIEAIRKVSTEPGFIDPAKIVLPHTTANGVCAFDQDGNPVPVGIFSDGVILLPPTQVEGKVFLYFGYAVKNNADPRMQEEKEPGALTLKALGGGVEPDPENWRNSQIARQEEAWLKAAQNFKPVICDNLDQCKFFRKALKHPNALLPFCAWHMAFDHTFDKAPRLLRMAPRFTLRFSCCKSLCYLSSFPFNHFKCTRGQVHRHLYSYVQTRTRCLNEIARLKEGSAEEMLRGVILERIQSATRRKLENGQIRIVRRPYDTGHNYFFVFQGRLNIEETGDYTFRTHANHSRFLWIDDKCIVQQFGISPIKTPREYAAGNVHLEKGLHKFLYVYQKFESSSWVALDWKKTADPDAAYHIMSSDDFMPGVPLEICAMRTSGGYQYPLAQVNDKYEFQTGKLERLAVVHFSELEHGKGFRLLACGKEVPLKDNFFLMPSYPDFKHAPKTEDTLKFELLAPKDEPQYLPLHPTFKGRRYQRVHLTCSLALALFTPAFLYDDETLTAQIQVQSRLPIKCPVSLLSERLAGETTEFSQLEELDLPPHHMDSAESFQPDLMLTRNIVLDGDDLSEGLLTGAREYRYELSMPGFQFDTKAFRIVSPEELLSMDFFWNNGSFYTEAGDVRLIPLLHRPLLHERRQWEIGKEFFKASHKIKRILVAGDDFNGFSEHLKRLLKERRNIDVEFFRWKTAIDGSPLPDSAADFANVLKETSADAVLLLPPSQATRVKHTLRDELRMLSLLIQWCREHKAFRRIYIGGPVPAASEKALSDTEQELCRELRSMKRSYGFDFLENYRYLIWSGTLSGTYRYESDGVSYTSPYPVTGTAAEILAEYIAGVL